MQEADELADAERQRERICLFHVLRVPVEIWPLLDYQRWPGQ